MKINLTLEEAYLVERILDEVRDRHLAEVANLLKVFTESDGIPKKFVDERIDNLVETFDMLNTVCVKLETARLK